MLGGGGGEVVYFTVIPIPYFLTFFRSGIPTSCYIYITRGLGCSQNTYPCGTSTGYSAARIDSASNTCSDQPTSKESSPTKEPVKRQDKAICTVCSCMAVSRSDRLYLYNNFLIAYCDCEAEEVGPNVTNTVKPLNKGHFGNNINSSLLSFVERLSSSRRFKMY